VTDFKMPYDDLTTAVRRERWGWFGEPWPSEICFEGDRLREEMRKQFPARESCLMCGQLFDEAAGDSGQALPQLVIGQHKPKINHVHKECMLRNVLGSLSCLQGRHDHDDETDYRTDALAVWDWVKQHAI
jgi:hypothetical protein